MSVREINQCPKCHCTSSWLERRNGVLLPCSSCWGRLDKCDRDRMACGMRPYDWVEEKVGEALVWAFSKFWGWYTQ